MRFCLGLSDRFKRNDLRPAFLRRTGFGARLRRFTLGCLRLATGLGRLAFFFFRLLAQYRARAVGCRLFRDFFFFATFLSRRPNLAISRKSLSSFKRSAWDMRAPINGLDRCEALRARRCAVTFVRRGTIAG